MAEAVLNSRIEKITGVQFLIGLVGLMGVIALANFVIDRLGPEAIAVDLPALERAIDLDPAIALGKFRDNPVLVTGRIASVHDDRITLDSIGFLNVQAYLRESPARYVEGAEVRLHCRRVVAAEYLAAVKPEFHDCAQQ